MTLSYIRKVSTLQHCPVCNAERTGGYASPEVTKHPYARAIFACDAQFHATAERIVHAEACGTRSALAARLITTEAENSPR